jgi:LCP family protein required for cell wall assembly
MAEPQAPPEYKLYRTRPRLLGRRGDDGSLLDDFREKPPDEKRRKPITVGRVVKWIVLALVSWVALSVVLFLISAQVNQDQVSADAQRQLSNGGVGIVSAQTTLILGSDQRTKGTKEPGASTSGPSRSDSILLVRTGGGHSAKLSIPRDTIVDIPGHGRDKINAAYAYGGPGLATKTVSQYLGIDINHIVEVNFENFPAFIDALGGIKYTGGCVVSNINGGRKNGGTTLRLRRGTHHLNGEQALALARTRKNECNTRQNDLNRAARQQKILSGIKSRLLSPATFFRLPWVSWQAPKAIRSDMAGPALLGLFGSIATSSSPPSRVLPGVPEGNGLTVPDNVKQREVRRFLKG